MGIYDRDYIRDPEGFGRPRGAASSPRSWSLVTWLIVLNVAVFLVMVMQIDDERIGEFSLVDLHTGRFYKLLTYQFVHAHLFHLGMNMMMLHFMGRPLHDRLGTPQFMALYLGAGCLGALAQAAFSAIPIIGASASIFGVLFAVIAMQPWREVYVLLFFVIPIRAKMWKIGVFVAGLEVVMFVAQEFLNFRLLGDSVAHLAHLGGAAFGLLWMLWVAPRFDRHAREAERQSRWASRFGTDRVVDAELLDSEIADSSTPSKTAPATPKPFVSAEIDAILDKISAHGMHSLTEEEKNLLHKSSENLARRVDRR